MREAQRQRSEEARVAAAANPPAEKTTQSRFAKPDMSQAQASVAAAGQRAGAYFSSWGSWAAEKRKSAWAGRAVAEEPKEVTARDSECEVKHMEKPETASHS